MPLLGLLDATVAADGEALVADPGRRHAAAFFERARRRGWSCEHVERGVARRGAESPGCAAAGRAMPG